MKFIKKLHQKLSALLQQFVIDSDTNKFLVHNREVWSSYKHNRSNQAEVLFELNQMHSAVIAYSYLANVLAEKHKARVIVFSNSKATSWRAILGRVFDSNVRKIYRSFNVSKFMDLKLSPQQESDALVLFDKLYPEIQSKSDVEKLSVDGVLIGDLVYDTYLRRESLPTVDLGDKRFVASLKRSIERFVFWKGYFDSHNVKAINISHCVYDLALPLRIAVSRNIPAYQINATHAYCLGESNFHAYTDFKYFPEYFSRLPANIQESGLHEAEQRLERRFAGEVGVDMSYSSKSAFLTEKRMPVLRKSEKVKILIATHCFFDSPHPYGFNLFPDFHEWLSFLGDISEKTDYDWYIKTHPDFLPGNKAIIESFLQRFPRFTLIPADTSHRQIIHEGIDFALTVYGTIGFEYAALGVPVINASMSNPHVAYNFNLHPETVDQYKDMLLHLGEQKIEVDKEKVYEYYFMKHIYNTNDWLFENYQQMIADLGGYSGQFTLEVYSYWADRWTAARHAGILAALDSFVNSGDFRLGNKHLGRELKLTGAQDR